ncbi:MAG: NADH:ubiquinone oxidoreductase, partial [Tissierellia bacterium]|nr:NADH:ubiquinone oxidoreductase [Tissierellia bacterium]
LASFGEKDVDIVITTRELAIMIKEAGINFESLPESDFDDPLGESTGAAVIFGATGGVIEATVRTAYNMLTGKELDEVEFHDLRGFEEIKEADIQIEGVGEIKIAVAHGLGNARVLLDEIRAGEKNYHAIEIMACPGGCIGGAGQPYHHGNTEILKKRAEGLYADDRSKEKRRSHENEQVKKLYEEFLDHPGSEKAHALLHTSYFAKPRL